MSRTPVLLAIAVVAVLLAGPPLATARQATPDATPVPLPGTPVAEQLAWVLGQLNGGAQSLTPAEVAARFTPAFLGKLPAEQVVGFTQQFAALGPFALEGLTRPPTATQANALITGAGGLPFVVPIAVEAAQPHRITGLNFVPVPPPPGVDLAPVVDAGTPVAGPGRLDGLFDVGGGRRLSLSCVGTGSPTVVLEAGLGDPAAPWFAVETAVAPVARVCSYDRANAGGGASDPAPGPRTGADAVADLHALLAAAGVPGPYVLVGHSVGGLFARLYAHTYPDEVAGLVLVDASHEEQVERRRALVSPEMFAAAQQATQANTEGIDLDGSFAQVRAARAAAPLRPMPLVVLSAGQDDPARFPAGWPMEAEAALSRELQTDLAGLVPGGRLVVAERSGHYVHQAQPELVVQAVRQVVGAVRDPSSWATSESPGSPVP